MKKMFQSLFAFVGITLSDDAVTPNGVFLSQEELTKMDGLRTQVETLTSKLEASQAAHESAETAAQEATGAKTKAEGDLATANSTIATQATKIAELEEKLLNRSEEDPELKGTGGEAGKGAKWSYTKNVLGIKK